ncbi:GNAT family N-acetyltransferase [Piscibacillus halophilus]|uniref:GNAT family N-acetyltransferase n=1 Tax=Piscibacillus halophilus TaxID=571933 RepID=UPI000B89F73F|nr:GNAT family N-acetyltransferase [Piscibacillus halophilus]
MNPILIDVPSKLETERLLLRAPESGDGVEVNSAIRYSIEELREWLVFAQTVPEVQETEANLREARAKFINRESLRYLIFDKEIKALIGTISFENINWKIPKAEIGYWINTHFAGKGYMTEAVDQLTAFGLEYLGFKRIEILCDSENQKSRQVAERAGYDLEGILKNDDRSADGDELRDTCVYARTL